MANFSLRLDMRSPHFACPPKELYPVAIDMAEWADQQGFAECMLSEHHGTDDNYLPSPLIMASAIAGRTRNIRIRISALILPLHDPLRIAEDVSVLDHISSGRIELVIAAGFRPSEFVMFKRRMDERGPLLEEGIKILKKAWSGETFDYCGTAVNITPLPLQQPHPPLLIGGSSKIAARRAARIGDGFVPALPELYSYYLEECIKLGITPGEERHLGPAAVFVAEDPDAMWQKIAPHVLHETNSYARWYAETGTGGPYQPITDIDTLRSTDLYQVLTPRQCIALAEQLGDKGWIFIQPLLGGLSPEIGWSSLNLLKQKVLPELAN